MFRGREPLYLSRFGPLFGTVGLHQQNYAIKERIGKALYKLVKIRIATTVMKIAKIVRKVLSGV